MIRLTLKPGREASVARRHPWLFSGGVASAAGDGADGHAEVVDAGGRLLARGAYSPDSQILARLWTFDGRVPDGALFRERFAAARQLREECLPPETTGYRAVNSEGDLCPGVLLDVYGDTAVLELTTRGTEIWRAEIEAAVREVFAPARLIVRETGSPARRRRPAERSVERRAEPSPPGGGEGRVRGANAFPSSRTASTSSPTSPAARRPASSSTSATTVPACARSPAGSPC